MPTKERTYPYGRLIGFNGQDIVHMPLRISELLPFKGALVGLSLQKVERFCFYFISLHDKWGSLIFEWQQHIPTYEEVEEQVNKYLKSVGRNVF